MKLTLTKKLLTLILTAAMMMAFPVCAFATPVSSETQSGGSLNATGTDDLNIPFDNNFITDLFDAKAFERNLSSAEASVDGSSRKAYTGLALEPGVTVTFKGSLLLAGTDYDVTYSENVQPGTGSIVITGKGIYTGSITKEFTIYQNSNGLEDEGIYLLVPKTDPDLALDVSGSIAAAGTTVQLHTVNHTEEQEFIVKKNADGTYRITGMRSGLSLNAEGDSSLNGASLQAVDANDTGAQKWVLLKNTDGSYTIVNNETKKAIDIPGGHAVRGSALQMYEANGTDAQKFNLVKTTAEEQESYLPSGGYEEALAAPAGQRTVFSLLQNAIKPVGRTLYILDGGWNYGNIPADPVDARIIGYQDAWWSFFTENAQIGYDFSKYTFLHGFGLDCSGYVHWTVYNTIFDTDGQNYDLARSFNIADEYKNYGWATTGDPDFLPGDIVSINEGNDAGHVYIVLGVCNDGSVLFAHSTLVPSATQGAGVQLSGTSVPGTSTDGTTLDSEAAQLADSYMKKYFPEWPFASVEESYETYVTGNIVKASWITDGSSAMSDPQGIQGMSAETVIKLLLGE